MIQIMYYVITTTINTIIITAMNFEHTEYLVIIY